MRDPEVARCRAKWLYPAGRLNFVVYRNGGRAGDANKFRDLRDLGVALEEALELFSRFPLVNDDEFAFARHEGVVDDPTTLGVLGDLL